LLAQIRAVINSRPLCYTSDTEDNYLSPAHLIGRPLTTVPDPDLSHIPVGRLGYYGHRQHALEVLGTGERSRQHKIGTRRRPGREALSRHPQSR